MYEALQGYVTAVLGDAVIIGPDRSDSSCAFHYKVMVPKASMFEKGTQASVLIVHHKTEYGDTLYGFESEADRAFFRDLLKCDKVGPHAAMAIMRLAPVPDIKQAIRLGRSDYLQNANGVNKAADGIVLKLQKRYSEEYARNQPDLLER